MNRVLMVPSWQLIQFDTLSPDDTLIVCHEALKLWQTGNFDVLLLSGGIFMPREIQSKPSSELMQVWFVARGVDPKRIVTETESLDTFDNIRCSLDALERNDMLYPRITVCTHPVHGRRIRWTFRKAHNIDVSLHPVRFPLPVKDLIMQWFCVAYHWYDTKGSGLLAERIRFKRLEKTCLVSP